MPGTTPLAGLYDMYGASVAARHDDGFSVSGFGFTAPYGLPGIGFIAWPEVVARVERLCLAFPSYPLLFGIGDGRPGGATVLPPPPGAAKASGPVGHRQLRVRYRWVTVSTAVVRQPRADRGTVARPTPQPTSRTRPPGPAPASGPKLSCSSRGCSGPVRSHSSAASWRLRASLSRRGSSGRSSRRVGGLPVRRGPASGAGRAPGGTRSPVRWLRPMCGTRPRTPPPAGPPLWRCTTRRPRPDRGG